MNDGLDWYSINTERCCDSGLNYLSNEKMKVSVQATYPLHTPPLPLFPLYYFLLLCLFNWINIDKLLFCTPVKFDAKFFKVLSRFQLVMNSVDASALRGWRVALAGGQQVNRNIAFIENAITARN